jgi:predicted short-subunit dehydrogenase-like oxidoreductase (DUF2520 family)
MDTTHSIGLIGAGKLAKSLLINVADGFQFNWVIVRNDHRKNEIEDITESYIVKPKLAESLHDCELPDIIMLAVSDKNIEKVAAQVAERYKETLESTHIIHFSGINSVDILDNCRHLKAITHKIHPYQTFYYPEKGIFDGIYWGVQPGSDSLVIYEFIRQLKGKIVDLSMIDSSGQVRYHASAVVASNFLNTLVAYSRELLSGIGIGHEILIPIINQTLKNAYSSIDFPLTGPIARGDIETVHIHLQSLKSNKDEVSFYASMSFLTASLCLAKGTIGEAKFKEFEKLLTGFLPK